MSQQDDDPIIDAPTYLGNIRYFFAAIDIDHMQQKGIDLGSYDGVKQHAVQIYSATSQGEMPPGAGRQWSANRCQTFLNWIVADYPMGTPPQAMNLAADLTEVAVAGRLRKDAAGLSQQEIDSLAVAFQGLMDRDPDDPNGYFAIAQIHGMPLRFCQHHNDPYNPWHRVYLKMFEDALRSIPGCAEVTLPYWDMTKPMPGFFGQAPFAQYKMPRAVGMMAMGDVTQRFTQAEIDGNLADYGFGTDAAKALRSPRWGMYIRDDLLGKVGTGFQQASIQAHDSGHLSTGPTMANQSYASFDPIFWFYHCNLDRHWWTWQRGVHGTDWATFQSLVDANRLPFWKAPLNKMAPFVETSDMAVSSDVIYDAPFALPATFRTESMRVDANLEFSIFDDNEVLVAVEGIERLNVPGSFSVRLLADGEPVARRAFFQSDQPSQCANCRTVPVVGLQIPVLRSRIVGKKLSVSIDVPGHTELGTGFPVSSLGKPTVTVRMPLEQ
ncbi:MAG: tyrosinase family protein [Novosphingobium sp.]